LLLEFGADWCGFCRVLQPAIATALSRRRQVRHVKVADGPGKPLGRSYQVKLWPTLIVLVDGAEVARLEGPTRTQILGLWSELDECLRSQPEPERKANSRSHRR
jgi:thiol-disulfide isomerase/thioredoxin